MKVISFLGITNYKTTRYVWNGQEKETELFPEAVAYFVKPEKILICLTPTARENKNWQELRRRFERDGVPYEPLPISEGHSEPELWEIFDVLTNAVQENERVIFDITYSFRSLPFLSFLAIAYLRAAKKVKVERVLYGAWEAHNEQNRSPVFDLTPFVGLLDWLTAVNEFLHTGSARYLAEQLERKQLNLSPLAENVTDISLGLELLRPLDVVQASNMLPDRLKTVHENLPKPFGVVSQSLETSYAQFSTGQMDGSWEHLRTQLRMINWYHEKQQYVHTLSMAREWLVSLLCAEFDLDMWDKDKREEMEFLLSGGMRKENGQIVRQSPYLDIWNAWEHRKRISRLWNGEPYELANLRNDVLHTGFRKNPQPAKKIIEQTGKIVQEINDIAKLWNLT